jgi:hypothetical protein
VITLTTNQNGSTTASAIVCDGRACGPYLHSITYYGYDEADIPRMFVTDLRRDGKRIDADIVYEAPCHRCGAVCLTDEWHGGQPHFGSGCECGGEVNFDAWQLSDEPHPSEWGQA